MKEGTSVFDKKKTVEKKIHGIRKEISLKYWLGWSGGYGNSKTEKT
jgi:hypothetical protein